MSNDTFNSVCWLFVRLFCSLISLNLVHEFNSVLKFEIYRSLLLISEMLDLTCFRFDVLFLRLELAKVLIYLGVVVLTINHRLTDLLELTKLVTILLI